MFPQRLDSTTAYDIAKAMIDGFNRHDQLFRSKRFVVRHGEEHTGRSATACTGEAMVR